MADIVRAVSRFRHDLAKHRDQATLEITQVYAATLTRLEKDLRRLQRDVDARRRKGLAVSTRWLEREKRYQELMARCRSELRDNGRTVSHLLSERERAIVEEAVGDASAIVAALQDEDEARRIERFTVTQIIAATSRGGAVRDVLEKHAGVKADDVRAALVSSVTRGHSPAMTARRMREAYGGALTNALTIARTEIARAQREASRVAWLSNPSVTGWWWQCRCSTRSCGYCWAQHGTEHSLSEPMATHPNCECLMLPITPGAEYGDTGAVRFARLSRARQLEVLGPSKLAAYEAGEITLDDLVGTSRHPVWGPVGRERSLRDVLGATRAAAYYPGSVGSVRP